MEQVSGGKVAKHPAQPPVTASTAAIKHPSKGSSQAIPPIGAHYHQSPAEVITIVRQGVPAERLIEISACLHRSKEWLFRTLKLPRSTMDHKIRQHERLSPEHSERVVGLERLIGQVQAMVEDTEAASDFNACRWVGQWLDRPVPALGGAKPADFMDTLQGQALVSRLLAQSQAGVFA
jgi:putative toxin-antitoxin system antitoxin component (TIGR02293 family)